MSAGLACRKQNGVHGTEQRVFHFKYCIKLPLYFNYVRMKTHGITISILMQWTVFVSLSRFLKSVLSRSIS
jgi:hypothetical protein